MMCTRTYTRVCNKTNTHTHTYIHTRTHHTRIEKEREKRPKSELSIVKDRCRVSAVCS